MESRHDGVHTFYVGKNAKLKYVEKHYGSGDGLGKKVMNPETVVYLEEGASMTMETTQIKGIDSTKRISKADMKAGSEFIVKTCNICCFIQLFFSLSGQFIFDNDKFYLTNVVKIV